ncbi:MAG: chloride channel protein [Opitutales bacterium]|nr:chloride channel protein [Opitutales bacterium]
MSLFEKGSCFNFVRVVVYGVVAGLLAVAFRLLLDFCYRHGIACFASFSVGEFLLYGFLCLAGTALLSAAIARYVCGAASGSGSPQLKLLFWKDFGFSTWRVTLSKFIASVLAVGGGASLGSEGPMVLIGGTAASNVAARLGVPAHLRREAALAGAASGLAAIFNAPLAAVAFVLEEIVGDFNSRLLGSVLIAALVGTLISQAILGGAPLFTIPAGTGAGWELYCCVPAVAAASTLCGLAFQWAALRVRRFSAPLTRSHFWLPALAGAFSVWAIGSAVFLLTGRLGVFFLGYDDLTAALNGDLVWWVAGTLLAAKLLATVLCYGNGACGGIFAPALFFGGTCGAALAGVLALFLPSLGREALMTLAVVGMCGGFATVVRAPVTAVLLVFEMTHDFSMLPALLLGVLISFSLAKYLAPRDFYDLVLDQNGESVEKFIPPRDLRAWHHLTVGRVMHEPVAVVAGTEDSSAFERLLEEHRFSYFPRIDTQGLPLGIVSRERRCLPAKTVGLEATILDAEQALLEQDHGVVLVVDGNGKLAGVFTLHDILRLETRFEN